MLLYLFVTVVGEGISLPSEHFCTWLHSKYSMGLNGTVAEVSSSSSPSSAGPNKPQLQSSCCCGLIRFQTAALLIAIGELAFFVYQIFAASASYDKTGDEYAFAFTLALFSLALAVIAVVLLLVGLRKNSPYFLVPHLLMQVAIVSSSLLLVLYMAVLLVGGTSVKIDTMFYEDSPRGELGLSQLNRYPPVRTNVLVRGLNSLFLALLFSAVVFLAVQIWFFTIVGQCYQLLRSLAWQKSQSELSGTSTTVLQQDQHSQNHHLQSPPERNGKARV